MRLGGGGRPIASGSAPDREPSRGPRPPSIWHRVWRDRRGGVAVIFAIAVPALVLITVGAVEITALHADRSRMQSVADATALNAASQMRFGANEQLLERARGLARADLSDLGAKADDPIIRFVHKDGAVSGIHVAFTARRQSFFGNILPPGGFVLRVQSTAIQLGTIPLCVLGTGGTANALDFPQATIVARSCLVHSNRDIALGGSSLVDAAAVQAVGGIDGGVPANAGTGAAAVPDPLTSLFDRAGAGACQHTSGVKVDKAGVVRSVAPGVHCRHFDIESGTLRFDPGVHHLKEGQLQLKRNAKIEGDNVTLVIWKDLEIKFDDGKVDMLSLTGSQGGAGAAAKWAGFALAVDPRRTGSLTLNFNEIRRLEGVVYAPSVRLIVPGGINASETTPWTVVVAKEFRVEGGRQLQINADYTTSSVPVPDGVGNRAGGGGPVRLVR